MKKTICAACGEGGGRFTLRGDKWYHVSRCTAAPKYRDEARSTFPFTATHLRPPSEGGPLEVQSLRQLRQLENRYGVAAEVYSNDSDYQGGKY
jgi:hypothetical protein